MARVPGPRVAAERRTLDFGAVLGARAEEPVGVASITASELLHGVHRAATTAQRQRREAFVERLLAVLPVFPFDLVTARIHASLWVGLASKGASHSAVGGVAGLRRSSGLEMSRGTNFEPFSKGTRQTVMPGIRSRTITRDRARIAGVRTA